MKKPDMIFLIIAGVLLALPGVSFLTVALMFLANSQSHGKR